MAVDGVATGALAVTSSVFFLRALTHFRTAWHVPEDAAPLIRGIRALMLAACAGLFLAAVVASSRSLLWLGVIILAEEIYETGVVLLILRAERAST